METACISPDKQRANDIVTWFCSLLQARLDQDDQTESEAIEELELLGVRLECQLGGDLIAVGKVRQYLTSAQVAARLNVGSGNVEKWAEDGIIPAVRITSRMVRFNWPDVEKALAERTGFKVDRPHLQTQIVTQRQASKQLKIPMAGLRTMAESGDVPSYRNGDGSNAALFFVLDDVSTALFKLSKELNFQEFLRSLRPPAKKRGVKS